MKISLWYIIWLITIVISGIGSFYMPNNWKYLFGFAIGNFASIFLILAKEDK